MDGSHSKDVNSNGDIYGSNIDGSNVSRASSLNEIPNSAMNFCESVVKLENECPIGSHSVFEYPHSENLQYAVSCLNSLKNGGQVVNSGEINKSENEWNTLQYTELMKVSPVSDKIAVSYSNPTHQCNKCNLKFANANELKEHARSHIDSKPFQCNICLTSFTQLTNMKTHQRIHTGERPYECSVCHHTFTQISNLKTHMKLHTGEKPFSCDMCDAKFTQQSNLKSHRLIHTGERPYKCDICDSSFVQSTHLRNHRRIHTDERPYVCDYCGSRFRQISNLKTHEKTHTGEKPFLCSYCGIKFAQKSNLKSHISKVHNIMHDTVSPRRGRKSQDMSSDKNICHICQSHFSAASNLKVHMRLHTGEKPFSCRHCSMAFAQKSNLKAHEMTHSDIKPYHCPDCSNTFKTKGNLRTHIIKKHNRPEIGFSFSPSLKCVGYQNFADSVPSSHSESSMSNVSDIRENNSVHMTSTGDNGEINIEKKIRESEPS